MLEMKKKTLVLLVTIVLLFSACAIFVAEPRYIKQIPIGVISSTTAGYENNLLYFEEIIEPDINDYCSKLPKFRFLPRVEFDFIVRDAEGSAERHLELVQEFYEEGINLIIGGFWSSQAYGSLDYINENGMLLVSPSSTSPVLAIPDDNLFRICPDDTKQGAAIAEMLDSKGVEELVIIYRDDAWGGGLNDVVIDEFEFRGGTILASIGYPPDEDDFTSYLQDAEDAAVYGIGTVGVELISFWEASDILNEADNYPMIYDLDWFGSDGTAHSVTILENAPDQVTHVKLYSTGTAPTYSSKFEELSVRYQGLTGYDPGFYTACTADAAWVLAMSVIETRSTSGNPKLLGSEVVEVFPDVASRYFGYSGWCLLNEAGDRMSTNYDIWGYGIVEGEPDFVYYGYYETLTGQVHWE
jgi:branched-chain amino acid transport system substrate-binding protein